MFNFSKILCGMPSTLCLTGELWPLRFIWHHDLRVTHWKSSAKLLNSAPFWIATKSVSWLSLTTGRQSRQLNVHYLVILLSTMGVTTPLSSLSQVWQLWSLRVLYWWRSSFVHSIHCTLYTVHRTLRTVHCKLHCTMYNIHCTLHTVQCTMYTEQCTLNSLHVFFHIS